MDRPMPGDLVMILHSDDCLVKDKSIGVIEGMINQCRESYLVCFNDNTFRDDTVVSCSGGPAYYIGAAGLKPSPRIVNKLFWKWKDYPRADGGVYYSKSCKVWILPRRAGR